MNNVKEKYNVHQMIKGTWEVRALRKSTAQVNMDGRMMN